MILTVAFQGSDRTLVKRISFDGWGGKARVFPRNLRLGRVSATRPAAAGGQTGPRQLLHCFLSKQSADVWRQRKIETEKDADLKYSHVVKIKIRTKLISQTYKIKKVKELLMHLKEEYI